ncbi:hypothetical protein Taro_045344 [Colocasia esculenta]|uniref:Uncharacterized protein n=1 Tax=Colocasia esculenta TaxID=4460 RepID=A0A843WWT5_COLES|nr:hypothetical protein [Colocasia esculenta]
MALAERCVKLSQVPEFLEEPALVETDFEEGDSVDDGLGVYLLDFEEKDEPGDLGSEEEDPVSSYVDGMKRFDEPTMAADEPTKEINLGTDESPKFRKLTLVHTPRAQNILADSLASLASSIPIPLGRSSETVSVQRLKIPSHADPWFSQLKSPSLRVHALSKEPEIDLDDSHPWYFDIENYLKDGSFPDYATSSDRRAIHRVSERYKIIGGILYKKSLNGVYLRCLDEIESQSIVEAAYSSECGGHEPKRHWQTIQRHKMHEVHKNPLRDKSFVDIIIGACPWWYIWSLAPHSSLLSPSLGLCLRELLTSSSSLSRRRSGRGGRVAVDASGRSPPRTTDESPRDRMSSSDAKADPVLTYASYWACHCCSRRLFSTRFFKIS